MMKNSNTTILTFVLSVWLVLSSFSPSVLFNGVPNVITRVTSVDSDGGTLVKTTIVLDKTTTRDDVIHTCTFLAKEDVQLTFERLEIGRRGGLGKSSIKRVEGEIKLPNGSTQKFEAGGFLGFRSIKIIYSLDVSASRYLIEMIEVVD